MKIFKSIKEYVKSEYLNLKNHHRLKLLSMIVLVIFYPITIPITIICFLFGCLIALLPGKKEYDKSIFKIVTKKSYIDTIFNKGNIAEYYTWKILNNQPEYKKVLINLYIPNDDHTSEIDSILINQHGIFVIESKGYSGWIFGNEKDPNWTQVIYKNKNKFYNPILQNRGHILTLKNILNIDDNSIFRSYIVFSERCTLKKIKVLKPNVKVIKRNQLTDTLDKDYELYGKVLSNEEIKNISDQLMQYMFVDKSIKEEHINYIKKFKNKTNL